MKGYITHHKLLVRLVRECGKEQLKVNSAAMRIMLLLSFLLPSWRTVRYYRPHLEERDPIWDDDWSYGPFIRRSPSWGFPIFLSCKENARRSVHSPQDHFIITLSLATEVTDATLGASGPLVRISDRSWWHRHTDKVFWSQPMPPWTTGRCS